MYLINYTPCALIGAFSVTTEAAMREQQVLVINGVHTGPGAMPFTLTPWLMASEASDSVKLAIAAFVAA